MKIISNKHLYPNNLKNLVFNKATDDLYRAQEGFVNLDSARRSKIEAKRSDRRSPAPNGQGEKEDRFGKGAASPNSQNLTERGIPWEDPRTKIKKIADAFLSFAREIHWATSMAVQKFATPSSRFHLPEKKITWKQHSNGLCVLLHGLRGHPCIWNAHYSFLKKHSDIDLFIPFIPQKGNCALEEAASPLLPKLIDYAKKYPGKPICLIGVSNGSRLATWLETELRTKVPNTSVKVSTIAGVHLGSRLVNRLQHLKIADFFLKPILQKELSYQSKKAQELLAKVKMPLNKEVAKRNYEFYGSTEDFFYVPDLHSSLPVLNIGEQHHIVHGQGHNSIVRAVAKDQTERCFAWIKSQNKSFI